MINLIGFQRLMCSDFICLNKNGDSQGFLRLGTTGMWTLDSFSTGDKVCLALTSSLLILLRIGKSSLTKKTFLTLLSIGGSPTSLHVLLAFTLLLRFLPEEETGHFLTIIKYSKYIEIYYIVCDGFVIIYIGHLKCILTELGLERAIRYHFFCWVHQMKEVTWKPSWELLTRSDPNMRRNRVSISLCCLLT